MRTPWLSVIMPTYNGAAYLGEALDSVVAEGDRDVELVIVDDGSTDDSVRIARSYQGRLNMLVIEPGRLGNWVAATNLGMKAARGEHFCWLHNDDAWIRGRLGAMRRLVGELPGAALYAHACRYIDDHGRRVGVLRAPLPGDRAMSPCAVLPKLLVQNFFAAPALLFSRRRAETVGWMDERLWYLADWDFCLKLAAVGATVYHDAPLACYRIHPGSLTTRGAHRTGELRRMFEIVLARHFAGAAQAAWLSTSNVAAARFSAEVNVTLAALASRSAGVPPGFLWRCLTLGPEVWGRYLNNSRIVERVVSRLRVRLASH